MLFLESKLLNHAIDAAGRLTLLQQLADQDLAPLIRSHRLRCFEDVLLNHDHVNEMESALASSTESTIGEPFVRGDLFCFQDYILFLVFEDDTDALRVGIVYEAQTAEPFRKLDSFCQEVRNLLLQRDGSLADWDTSMTSLPQGFRTFIERQDADSLYTSLRKEDRKSTRLNSSHVAISYAVFCLKKKK